MRKFVLEILVVFALTSIALGALAFSYSGAFAIGIPLAGIVAGITLMGLSCPNCGQAVLYREHKVFGTKIIAFFPWPPKTCPNCGTKLLNEK